MGEPLGVLLLRVAEKRRGEEGREVRKMGKERTGKGGEGKREGKVMERDKGGVKGGKVAMPPRC